MRDDLNKVLTERPRGGSDSRNLKTRARFKDYDDAKEDAYSLPKRGKALMGNRALGPHDESKDFADKLGPLKRWLASTPLIAGLPSGSSEKVGSSDSRR